MSRVTKPLIAAIAVLLSTALFTCAGGAGVNQTGSTAGKTTAPTGSSAPAPRYFTGDGGKGMSLAVLVPSAQGISADQNYLPTMVQGVLVGDLTKLSAISVLDRLRLETVLKETESGIYRSEADYGRLGEIANVDYALTGSITKTGSGYAMQIQIVGTGKNTIGITKAAYSGSCTIAELDNFTGIRRASLDLLTQMGITLTDAAKNELSGAANASSINAQTALAQGIVAQRGGSVVETMAKFYEAASYDPSFNEAVQRANTMSATVRTGSLRENVLNDIAWRDEWVKILDDATKYLRSNPIYIAQVIYDTDLKQGKTNYDRRTVEFTFPIYAKGVPYPQTFVRMVEDLNAGLTATVGSSRWGLKPLSLQKMLTQDANIADIIFSAELINSNGKVIAREAIKIFIGFAEDRTVIKSMSDGYILRVGANTYEASFTVRASDITDQMTINTSSRTGSKTNSQYKAQVMTTVEYDKEIIARYAGDKPIVGAYSFYNKKLSKVTFPMNVAAIGEFAFARNSLKSITIPKGVLYIGREAFSHNIDVKRITIPDSVVYIDRDAFYSCSSLEKITIGANVYIEEGSYTEEGWYGGTWDSFVYSYVSSGEKKGTYKKHFLSWQYSKR